VPGIELMLKLVFWVVQTVVNVLSLRWSKVRLVYDRESHFEAVFVYSP
jgi:hypothetical protein